MQVSTTLDTPHFMTVDSLSSLQSLQLQASTHINATWLGVSSMFAGIGGCDEIMHIIGVQVPGPVNLVQGLVP